MHLSGRVSILTLIVASLLACGDPPGNQAIRGEPTLETFERRMCACTDVPCTREVIRDMTRWSKRLAAPAPPHTDAAAIMARYNACLTAVTTKR